MMIRNRTFKKLLHHLEMMYDGERDTDLKYKDWAFYIDYDYSFWRKHKPTREYEMTKKQKEQLIYLMEKLDHERQVKDESEEREKYIDSLRDLEFDARRDESI